MYSYVHIYIKITFESSKDLQASAAAAFLVPFFSKTFLIFGRTLDFQYPIFLLFQSNESPWKKNLINKQTAEYNFWGPNQINENWNN